MQISPKFEDFKNDKNQLIYTKISADLFTPVGCMLQLKDQNPYAFLLESVQGGESRGRYSIIGLGRKTYFEANYNQPNVLADLKKLIRETVIELPADLPPMASGLFGYIGYDAVRLFEKVPDKNPDELGIPDILLFVPEVVLVFDSVKDSLFIICPAYAGGDAKKTYDECVKKIEAVIKKISAPKKIKKAKAKSVINFISNTTREEYHAAVNKAKAYITAGDIFQLVPSQRFTSKFNLSPFAFYRSLRHLNPSPFLFYLQLDKFHIIGSSPEILVRLQNGKVTIRPIAGTRPRGKDAADDEALAKDLLADQKEIAEHLMLLDLGRNDVGRVSKGGSVKVTERMKIEKYSHVMHIVSNVEGDIAEGKDAVDALAAGFPAGTVSGAPKIRAMEIIDEIEKTKRKFYAGAIGYFSGSQMDSCIALRTALIKDGKIHLQAGGGVVADSDPESEYQETINKAKALMKAAELAKDFV
jgi:anthranilate synthase component 1